MGFFDKLEKTWTSWGTSKSFDLIGDSWADIRGGAKTWSAGVVNLWHGLWDDDRDFGDALREFQASRVATSVNLVSALGKGISGLAELPVLKQVVGTADWAQGEIIKRPVSTAGLVTTSLFEGEGNLFSGETWRKAYNMSEHVSAGQSSVLAGAHAVTGMYDLFGADEEAEKRRARIAARDPRTKAGQEAFHSNPWLMGTSGTIDAALTMFVDPTVVLGKAGVAAKLRYLSKPQGAAALRRAEPIKYLDTERYKKLHDFIRNADSAEQVRQRVFASHRSGDKAAALLFDVADDEDLYNATFLSLYGDVDSWEYLTENAPRIAAVTGRTYANKTIGALAKAQGTSPEVDAMISPLRETETKAFVDAIANGKGAWGEGRGALLGQNLPRLTLTSKWRTGVHQAFTFGPAVFRGSPLYPFASRARYILPTAKYTRFLDVNDTNSTAAFRANLERAPIPRERVEFWVSNYGRATSPESRSRQAHGAENEIFVALAEKHGFTKKEAEALLPAINEWRVGNRRLFSTSRRFLSKEARELAEAYIASNGHQGNAPILEALADDMDEAIARGEQPQSVLSVFDEDGNLVLMPERFEVSQDKPVTLTQHADVLPMVDWRVLDSALWWHTKGGVGAKAFQVLDMGRALLDAVNSVWKATALMRPGYTPRTLSDDTMRRGALYGAGPVVMATARGMRRSGANFKARFKTLFGRKFVDAEVVDEVAPFTQSTDLTREPLGGPYEFESDKTLAEVPGLEPDSVHRFNVGNVAATERLSWLGGGKVIRKKASDYTHAATGEFHPAEIQQDREELASLVARAMGVVAPEVHRASPDELYMQHMPGQPAGDALGLSAMGMNEAWSIVNSDAGRLLGLFDILIANPDRHEMNWMVDIPDIEGLRAAHRQAPEVVYIDVEGEEAATRQLPAALTPVPIAIDHGMAFMERLPDNTMGAEAMLQSPNVFTEHFLFLGSDWAVFREHDISPSDIAEIGRRLETLKSEFERLGHVDWYDKMMKRLEVVGRTATGTRNRLVPGEPDFMRTRISILSYDSIDRALADGVVGVDDYVRAIEQYAPQGEAPLELQDMYQGFKDGIYTEAQYRRGVVDRAMRAVGRGAYSEPAWQSAFLDHLTEAYANRPQGRPGAPAVVDPFTGASPEGEWMASDFALSKGRTYQSVDDTFNPDDLYDFIADNADDLLKPRNILYAYVTPEGNLSLSVATAGSHITEPIKATGGRRIKFAGKEGGFPYQEVGQGTVKIRTPQGEIEFEAAFEGADGQRYRAQASTRGPSEAWADQMSDTAYGRLINESTGHVDVHPDQPHYPVTWERVANLQLANDPVARMFLDGKSVEDVLNWLRNTPAGRAYWGRMGPQQSRYVEQIYTIQAMVDTYVPHLGDDVSDELRRKVLGRVARLSDFEKVMRRDEMPNVHGASLDVALGGPFMNRIKNWTDKIFKVLSDLPADKASRFPFFADRYNAHLNELANAWSVQYGQEAGQLLPADLISKVQRQARDRALADTKKYLYDSSAAFDLASATKLMVPFSSAIADSFVKWGVIVREKGVLPPVINIMKIWLAPDRAGLVQDEDGNVKRYEDGQYVWYSVNPKTGEQTKLEDHKPKQEYVTMQLPFGMAPDTRSGAKMVSYINKDVFNTFLGLPTAGPIVAYPVNEFALKNPALAEKWFIRKFVLPYGATADEFKSFAPSTVRGTYYWITGNEESHRNLAQAIMQTEYTRYVLGQRAEPPTMDEVQEIAKDMAGLQFMSSFFGVSQQFKSPYQPYIDYYHQLQAQDPQNALARFYDEMGDEYRLMTASVSRNILGLPASVETFKQQKRFKDLIVQYPELAALIVGREGAGEFSATVYQAQLEQALGKGSNKHVREIMSLEESLSDAETRYVWQKYTKLMDAIDADLAARGLKSLTQKGARDLKRARDKFIQDHKFWVNPQGAEDIHPWYNDFMSTDRARMARRLYGMAQIAEDERIGNRDDMRGLSEYLDARQDTKAEMKRRGFSTLGSREATRLRNRWESYVFDLKFRNLAFAQLHDRWLTADDLSADIELGAGVT